MGDAFNYFGEKITVFNPKSKPKLAWDLLIMFLIFWNFLNISITIAFREKSENVFLLGRTEGAHTSYYNFLVFSFFLMIVDIFITLNTSYYEAGALVGSRKKIFKNYLQRNLLIDILSEAPFFFQIVSYYADIDSTFVKNINLLFFLKYYNLRGVFKVLEEFLSLDEKNEAFFLLLQLFAKIFFVAHFLGCLWHSVGYLNATPGGKSWLNKMCLDINEIWTERYIYSLYFALTTMTTVGYGDVSPQNQLEVLMAMFTMLIGSAMFGYAINNIGELLKKMNHKEDQLKNEIRSLNRFMKSKNINYELQVRARKYLEYLWNEERLTEGNETELLSKLSKSIRNEILLQSHGTILNQIPMLNKNFSAKTILKLINLIKTVRYSPEEVIFEENECQLDPNLYLITHGEVELLVDAQRRNEKPQTIKVLKAGESFGEVSFFTCFPQDFTSRSKNYSTVYIIKQSDFISAIKDSPDDWENFCMIKDKIMLYGDFDDLYFRCYSCDDKHLFKKCPALKYIPSKYKTVMNYQKEKKRKFEFRRTITRERKMKKFNSLLFHTTVLEKCTNYNYTNQKSEIEEEDEEEDDTGSSINQSRKSIDIPNKNRVSMNSTSIDNKIKVGANANDDKLLKTTLKNNLFAQQIAIEPKKIDKFPIPQSTKFLPQIMKFPTTADLPPLPKDFSKAIANKKEDLELEKENSSVSVNNQKLGTLEKEVKNELFSMSFDYFKNFGKYFPNNNPGQVIVKMNFKFRRNNLFSRNLKLASFFTMIGTRKKTQIELESPVHEFNSPRKRR